MHMEFGGKTRRNKQLGRPRLRWDDIKMDLREIGWCAIEWTDLAQAGISGGLL
jgi:hypothetical protein